MDYRIERFEYVAFSRAPKIAATKVVNTGVGFAQIDLACGHHVECANHFDHRVGSLYNCAECGRIIDVGFHFGEVCTAEEQAGPYAGKCQTCHRKTIHQHTKEPMCGCKPTRIPNIMKYEYLILCPDSEAGYATLHENLSTGWELVLNWHDFTNEGNIRNHIVMRRELKNS